jgi:hypothetical protein
MVHVVYEDNSYDPDDVFTPMLVTIDLSPTSTFTFDEFDSISNDSLLNIWGCMFTGQRSCEIGGGGNSNWSMYVDNQHLHIDVDISGSGEGCVLRLSFRCDENIQREFASLIAVGKCITNKTKYVNA